MTSKYRRLPRLAIALICCVALVASLPTLAGGWTMLPDDVIAAVHLDFAALAKSELYGSLKELYGQSIGDRNADYLEFVEATGFDLETDLRTLTIGAGQASGGAEGAFYLIATGEFDREKIQAYAKESDAVQTGKHGKLTTYVPNDLEIDAPPPTIAWLNDQTMIVASQPDFAKLVDSAGGSGLTARSSVLGGLLAGAEGQFYVAMDIPDAEVEEGRSQTVSGNGINRLVSQLQTPAAGPMKNLESMLITLNATSGLELTVRGSTDSEENGRLVYEMLNGYLMMGRSMAAQNPDAAGVLEELELVHDGAAVEIAVAMSGEEVRAALQRAGATSTD